jgi:hypothetical protein
VNLRLLPLLLWIACAPDSGGPDTIRKPGDGDDTDDTDDTDDSGVEDDTGDVPDPGPPAPYLIVTTDALAEVAGELADYRVLTNHDPQVLRLSELPSEPDALVAAVQERLRDMQQDDLPLYVVLLGDAGDPALDLIPAIACENVLGDCYTDNRYGDLDGDRVPDAAVGRIPAHTPEQARAYLSKVQRHETETAPGPWNRRFILYASLSGFGADIETLLEFVMLEGLASVDPAFEIVGLYDNPESLFYYLPFEEKVVDLYNAGSVFTMYVGHGSSDRTEGLSVETLDQISCEDRMPIVAFFACNNGMYAGEDDSLAEAVLWKDDGPVAAFAATAVTHPYANAVGPYEFQRAMFSGDYQTLGPAIVAAKHAFFEESDDPIRTLIDFYAVIYELDDQADELLRQTLDLYNLMGDPALSLGLPDGRVDVAVVDGGVAQGQLSVQGTTPGVGAGTAWVSLEVPRNVVLGEAEVIDPDDPDPAVVQSNWARSVSTVVTMVEVPVAGGTFEASLTFDPDLPGDTFFVKVYASGADRDAFGYAVAP